MAGASAEGAFGGSIAAGAGAIAGCSPSPSAFAFFSLLLSFSFSFFRWLVCPRWLKVPRWLAGATFSSSRPNFSSLWLCRPPRCEEAPRTVGPFDDALLVLSFSLGPLPLGAPMRASLLLLLLLLLEAGASDVASPPPLLRLTACVSLLRRGSRGGACEGPPLEGSLRAAISLLRFWRGVSRVPPPGRGVLCERPRFERR